MPHGVAHNEITRTICAIMAGNMFYGAGPFVDLAPEDYSEGDDYWSIVPRHPQYKYTLDYRSRLSITDSGISIFASARFLSH